VETTAVEPEAFANRSTDIEVIAMHNAPVATLPGQPQQTEEMKSSTEKQLDKLEKKLDQVLELLHQLTMHGDEKKRIPWE
jgi:uncharacterized protein YecA (UPF0149 family)